MNQYQKELLQKWEKKMTDAGTVMIFCTKQNDQESESYKEAIKVYELANTVVRELKNYEKQGERTAH